MINSNLYHPLVLTVPFYLTHPHHFAIYMIHPPFFMKTFIAQKRKTECKRNKQDSNEVILILCTIFYE